MRDYIGDASPLHAFNHLKGTASHGFKLMILCSALYSRKQILLVSQKILSLLAHDLIIGVNTASLHLLRKYTLYRLSILLFL